MGIFPAMFLAGSCLSFKLPLHVNLYEMTVKPVSYSGAAVKAVLKDKIYYEQCALGSKISHGTEI